jgi:hypothetical protein
MKKNGRRRESEKSRVARWHIFKQKIFNWLNFRRDFQWKLLVYLTAI